MDRAVEDVPPCFARRIAVELDMKPAVRFLTVVHDRAVAMPAWCYLPQRIRQKNDVCELEWLVGIGLLGDNECHKR